MKWLNKHFRRAAEHILQCIRVNVALCFFWASLPEWLAFEVLEECSLVLKIWNSTTVFTVVWHLSSTSAKSDASVYIPGVTLTYAVYQKQDFDSQLDLWTCTFCSSHMACLYKIITSWVLFMQISFLEVDT